VDRRKKRILEISIAITEGEILNLDLTCPYCNNFQLTFSFTRSKAPWFGLFIECKNCGQREHFILSTKPRNFDEKYVIPEYQYLEDQMVKFADQNRK
jgi:transcription elongation factor Elf1